MSPPRRWDFRGPLYLYRAGLGFLLGKRMLMLEHRGRKTGNLHRTVLEVVDLDDRAPIVVSGFGPGSDWFKNILADPSVGVIWGSRYFDALARPLSAGEAAEVFDNYRRGHPRLAAVLARSLWLSIEDDGRVAAAAMPVVRLEPRR